MMDVYYTIYYTVLWHILVTKTVNNLQLNEMLILLKFSVTTFVIIFVQNTKKHAYQKTPTLILTIPLQRI